MAMMTVMMNYGFLVFGVTDYVEKQFTLHYGAVMAGEPREEKEKEAC
jgi:NAD(P)H dehydrogenase (quinone)